MKTNKIIVILILLAIGVFVFAGSQQGSDPVAVAEAYYTAPKFFAYNENNENSVALHALFTKELHECMVAKEGSVTTNPEAGFVCGLEDAPAFQDPFPFEAFSVTSTVVGERAVVTFEMKEDVDFPRESREYVLLLENGDWKIDGSKVLR